MSVVSNRREASAHFVLARFQARIRKDDLSTYLTGDSVQPGPSLPNRHIPSLDRDHLSRGCILQCRQLVGWEELLEAYVGMEI